MGSDVRALNSVRQDEIADLAEAVADEHFPEQRIEPKVLIERKGITFSIGDYGDAFDGLIEHKGGRFHIYCNRTRLGHKSRVRFTLGHELGHYFIPEHRQALEAGVEPHPSFSEQYQTQNPAEREADLFASSFLMPSCRFQAAAKRYDRGLATILPMAEDFQTSWTSTAVRYIKLDLTPCAIIKWSNDGNAWSSFSDSMFRAGFRKLNLSKEHVPRDSPTGRVHQLQEPPKPGYFEGVTVASQWFPFITQGAYNDIFMIEQAVSLGEYGHLTVIFPKSGSIDLHT